MSALLTVARELADYTRGLEVQLFGDDCGEGPELVAFHSLTCDLPAVDWVHSGGEIDGSCAACLDEMDETDSRDVGSDPHSAVLDLEFPAGTDEPTCGVCGHAVESVQ